MGLVEILGLDDEQIQHLMGPHWDCWAGRVPALGCVPAPRELAVWRWTAPAGEVDRVLRGLAELAAADGFDDVDAARVLAWLMLPAAAALAAELRGPDVEEHLAARLWIAVRSYPWATTGKVAANIAGRVRRGVLLDLDSTAQLENHDRTQARTVAASDFVVAVGPVFDPSEPLPDAAEEVAAVLEWGCANDVISDDDRELMLDVLVAAGLEEGTGSSCQPLLGDKVSARVGSQRGVAGRTVRRRARRTIAALATAVGGLGRSATTGLVA